MANIVAAIDIGSYSIRLGIAKTEPFEVLFEKGNIVELGTGVKETGFIKEEKIKEAIETLKDFKSIIDNYQASSIVAVGTEALRKAKNKDEFIKRAKEEAGIDVKIISGEEEGELSFKASAFSLGLKKDIVVIDQGGGSTEFVYGKGSKIVSVNSLPFGIVNLTEEFFKHDPPTDQEIKALFDFLDKSIKQILKPVDTVVGIGGTITTIAALHYHVYPYSGSIIHGKILSFEALKNWFWTLAKIPTEERKKYKEIEDKRAKAIVSGIGIFYKVLELFEKDYLVISDFGLKHALLLKAAGLI
ncbi:MAG: Ppx/GppA phosphatase family protein [Hydrogenobaculum sp.]